MSRILALKILKRKIDKEKQAGWEVYSKALQSVIVSEENKPTIELIKALLVGSGFALGMVIIYLLTYAIR